MGGVDYLKSILAPTPDLALIPTGGVTTDNAIDFIQAGAIGVGLSTDLFLRELILQQDWQAITKRAKKIQSQLINL